jgi:hypothetical protein
LTSLVVHQLQFINDIAGVVRCVFHRKHAMLVHTQCFQLLTEYTWRIQCSEPIIRLKFQRLLKS